MYTFSTLGSANRSDLRFKIPSTTVSKRRASASSGEKKVLCDTKINKQSVDDIVLVGRTGLCHRVQSLVPPNSAHPETRR
jgi:hypothetical protein